MKVLKYFWDVVNLHTLLIIAITVLATAICFRLEWTYEIPTDLIGIAIIFPIVFSINAAYSRRERALEVYARIKANAVGIYYAFRDWQPGSSPELTQEVLSILKNFFDNTKLYFMDKGHREQVLHNIYNSFSRLSELAIRFREKGISTSEVTVIDTNIRSLLEEFEHMKNILLYRTPVSLRAYSKIFLNIFPIFFAPYFAHVGKDSSPVMGYLVGGMYALILVSLDNIQTGLENPFDQEGEDDLELEGKEYIEFVEKKDVQK